MNHENKSRLMLASAMTIFGTLGTFVRSISVSTAELALYRAVLASLLIGGYLLFTGSKIPLRRIGRMLPLLLISGVAMGINWILLFEAYRYTSVSAATLSYYFAPCLVTAICPFLFREKLTGKQILCFVMSTVGIILITGTVSVSGTGTDLIGICFGLGAAVFYASVVLINKFIRDADGIHRTLLQFLAAVITLIPYVALTGGVTLQTMDTKGWICLLIVGLIHTGITYCMYFTSLRHLKGQEAAILSYMDPLTAVIISVTVLGESMTMWQAAGGVLILGFTLWNELPAKKKQ